MKVFPVIGLLITLTSCAPAAVPPSSTSAEAGGAVAPAEPGRSPDRLTKEGFEQVKSGMSLAEVEAVLGPGSLAAESEVMGQKIQSYNWTGAGKGITVTLQDGVVTTKMQFGL